MRGFHSGPPMWRSEPVRSKTSRFKVNSALSNDTFTVEDLVASVVGIYATGSTTSNHLCVAMRLRKIKLWFTATSVGANTEAIIDWNVSTNESLYSPNSSISRSTMSSAEYAYLCASPPKDSLADLWQRSTTTFTLVSLSAPAGAIIDITVDYVLNDSDAAISGPALSGATSGTIYHKQPNADANIVGNLNTIA